jgi:hypothetical protein
MVTLCLPMRALQIYPDIRPSGMRGGLVETWSLGELGTRGAYRKSADRKLSPFRSCAPQIYPTRVRILIPPPRNARVRPHAPPERNRNVRALTRLGRRAWYRVSGACVAPLRCEKFLELGSVRSAESCARIAPRTRRVRTVGSIHDIAQHLCVAVEQRL